MKTIELTQGQVALVDAADYEWLNRWKWYAQRNWRRDSFYAVRKERTQDGKQRTIPMHRQILGLSNDTLTDHRDGNGLNNTRGNLRPATKADNNRNVGMRQDNASGYKGVSARGESGKWLAQIRIDGKQKRLGVFDTAIAAALAYDAAALKTHGQFARLNFPRQIITPQPHRTRRGFSFLPC